MGYTLLHTTNDREEAMVIESMLKSAGIECLVEQETVGKVYALTADGLGEVKIFVPEEDAERAKRLIEET